MDSPGRGWAARARSPLSVAVTAAIARELLMVNRVGEEADTHAESLGRPILSA
jgi:hypothetical protein